MDERFAEACLCKDVEEALEAEKKDLLDQADTYLEKPLLTRGFSLQKPHNEAELIDQYLQQFPGIILGEINYDLSSKQFLMDNMGLLASRGVTTLFMQNLLSEPHQTLLDEYFSQTQATMPRRLELYLEYLDSISELSEPATYTNVIKAAKQHGIRIIAFDTEATSSIGLIKTLADLSQQKILLAQRCKAVNLQFLKCFRDIDIEGKFVAFVGSAHVSTYENIPGISDLIGCPNLVIQDAQKSKGGEAFVHNATVQAESTVTFDVLYYRNPESKITA
jgi:hypothetical protein